MHYPEEIFSSVSGTGTAETNIKNNARIAALHSYKVPVKPPMPILITDYVPDIIVDIKSVLPESPIEIHFNSADALSFYNVGEVYVYFSDILWEAFAAGGYLGEGFTIVENNVCKISSFATAKWYNIYLGANQLEQMAFSFHYKDGIDTFPAYFDSRFKLSLIEDLTEKGVLYLHTTSQMENPGFGSVAPYNKKVNPKNLYGTLDSGSTIPLLYNQVEEPRLHNIGTLMNVSPNPFSTELEVSISNHNGTGSIYLRDVNGKMVFETTVAPDNDANASVRIPSAFLSDGVYFVCFLSENVMIVKKAMLVR